MENIIIETKENLPVTTRTIGINDLIDIIYKGNSSPQDKRFLPVKDGGVFKYFDLSETISPLRDKTDIVFYPVTEVNKKIVALSELQVDPYKDKNLWIKFISVDPEHQGNKYASKLIEEIITFAKNKGYSLETSFYTEDGSKKLKRLIHELSEKYQVKLIDQYKDM